MKLAFRKDPAEVADPQKSSEALGKCRQWHEFLLVSINTLLQFIKDFSFDIIAKRTRKNRVVSENELTSAISVDANDKFAL